MVLDPECQLKVAKKSFLEEGKKEEKSSQHNKIYTLKKRSEFLNLRRNCSTLHGKVTIGNYRFSSNKTSKVGLTVTKKIGSARDSRLWQTVAKYSICVQGRQADLFIKKRKKANEPKNFER